MATTNALDKEVSPAERPRRPIVPPAGAPNTPIMPDPPLTPGEKQAIEAERRNLESDGLLPPGGLPEGIPHGDRNPGSKPPHRG